MYAYMAMGEFRAIGDFTVPAGPAGSNESERRENEDCVRSEKMCQ